jgi:hypothetical protein
MDYHPFRLGPFLVSFLVSGSWTLTHTFFLWEFCAPELGLSLWFSVIGFGSETLWISFTGITGLTWTDIGIFAMVLIWSLQFILF